MVCLSVGQSVRVVSAGKTAEPIDMMFGLWTRVGPRNHILDGVQITPCEGAIFRGKDTPADLSSLAAAYEFVHRRRCGTSAVVAVRLTERTRFNHSCAAAMRTLSNYFDHLFYKITPLVIVHVRTAGH